MTRLYPADTDPNQEDWGYLPRCSDQPELVTEMVSSEVRSSLGNGMIMAATPMDSIAPTPAPVLNGKTAPGADLPPNTSSEARPVAVAPETELPDFPAVTNSFWPVLRNQNFLKLWAGQVFSQLADKVYLVLIIALITSQFQAADQSVSGWVSSVMIAFTIPAVLFGSLAGVFVDRWSKKSVLVLTNLLRGGLVLLLPPLLWLLRGWGNLAHVPLGFWAVLGVTFLVSTLTQFFAPAEQATMPLIVERQSLLSANSLYTLTMMVAVIVGFAAGDPLLAIADQLSHWIGAVGIGRELVVGGSYAIAGVLLTFLQVQEQCDLRGPTLHLWQDMRDGLRYLNQQPLVRGAMLQLVILFSIFAALAVLMVRLAELLPEITAAQFGFLLAAGGLGMAIGVGILGQLGQRCSRHQLGLYGSLGMGLSLGGLALVTQHLWPALLLLASLGAAAALVGIPMQTMIQEETPEALRGKIFGLQNNAVNIALTLPLALAGVAETYFGLQTVLLALAAIAVTGGSLTWYISRTK